MTVMMYRAVVYRAYPTREQAALIERTCGCARFLYNRMLADKIAHYRETGEMLRVTPARYKREFAYTFHLPTRAALRRIVSLVPCRFSPIVVLNGYRRREIASTLKTEQGSEAPTEERMLSAEPARAPKKTVG